MDVATQNASLEAPIFRPATGGTWLPDQAARGPFDGLQGGAVAALMCSQVEALADADQLGFVASFNAHFLRPTPLEPLSVACEPLRRGRRVNVVDVRLSAASGLCAVARATLIGALPNSALPTPPRSPTDPAAFALTQRTAPHGGAWLMDEMEVRASDAGVVWFRLRRPINDDAGPMSRVLPAADWAHGLGPPLGAANKPLAAIPNPDVSVRLFRAPRGSWIGVGAASAWSLDGVGAGWASLSDEEGLIGQVAMSIAVTLLQP
jgi:hypothetical protein